MSQPVAAGQTGSSQQAQAPQCVILLHGLVRSPASMTKLAKRLEREGYRVVNQGYKSRKFTVAELAAPTINVALSQCPKQATVHFVTHSMGSILLRHYLKNTPLKRLGRVVMLGPPNHGSQVVDKMANVPGFGLINGKAGDELGTGAKELAAILGPADFDLGVIAGTKTINPILSAMLPGPNDGKVTVASTKLEGMNAHLIMPVAHPFLMTNNKALNQVVWFLAHGRFKV